MPEFPGTELRSDGKQMNATRKLAEMAPVIPGAVRALSHVPFSWRKGPEYPRFRKEADEFEQWSPEKRRDWIFRRVRDLVAHAESRVPFYRDLYLNAGVSSRDLNCYDDLLLIPVVTKAMMKESPLGERCAAGIGAIDSNTGGTTGQPLSFRVEPQLTDKEWAYMYHQWTRRGWKPGFLKLRFGGANLGDLPYLYVPTEGEFLINTYQPQETACREIANLLKRWPIHYLHGYPSAVAAFARHAGAHHIEDVVAPIRRHLRGILLGSEFPAPCYREVIEDTFGPRTMSWYGHSEKTILAGEKHEPFIYHPLQRYGWTEALARDDGASCRLVGTNLDGYACPFIRYDTGDLVEPVSEQAGMLGSFRVAEGRIGDTVTDASGSEISLTALIFGRHHGVFGQVSHLQVAQREPGEVLLLASGLPDAPDREARFWSGFDTTGVAMRFKVSFRDEPLRTSAGKVALKVPYPMEGAGDQ